MERCQYSELSERLSYFMQWVDDEMKNSFRALEEKSTLRNLWNYFQNFINPQYITKVKGIVKRYE